MGNRRLGHRHSRRRSSLGLGGASGRRALRRSGFRDVREKATRSGDASSRNRGLLVAIFSDLGPLDAKRRAEGWETRVRKITRLASLPRSPGAAPPSSWGSLLPARYTGAMVLPPSAPGASRPAELPRSFGRYTLEEILGAGGMGRVYRATLHGPSGFAKPVALKVLKTRDQNFLGKFFAREARIGGWLHHPNVVEIYDYGTVADDPFLAMELVDGWPLDAFLERNATPPPSVILDLALQIARGLQHAHDLEVDGVPIQLVHRDLKPANILISRRGGVKVVDFGLARPMHCDADEGLTQSGMLVGTPAYMSPEQPMGDEHLDRRSDIFAFGVILYELVSGQHPWPRANLLARMDALAHVDQLTATPGFWEVPSQRLPGVERVLRRCLREEPADRFDHCLALITALRQLRRERPPGPDLRSWLQDGPEDLSVADIAAGASPEEPAVSWPRHKTTPVMAGADLAPSAPGPSPDGGEPSEATTTPHNLPPERDAFIGRHEDLAGLQKHLEQGRRLLTLLGPGGTGKTRLSLRLAAEAMERFPGGVFFCDLAEARSQADLLRGVALAMEVPLDPADSLEQVGHAIAGHDRILLIFDNFEQIVEFAGATLGHWLDLAPEAHFVVTSRTRLGIRGETVFDLAPLPSEESIELFFARARAVRPVLERTPENTPFVGQIVARLDYLPLAIELAAARSRVLPPERLLARLSDRFRLLQSPRGDGGERQMTLRGAIEWSWQLLRTWEQVALAQLSVFRGGFALESAEAVLDLDDFEEAPWPMDVVESLIDQSLLRRLEPRPGLLRYGLLESIRIFSQEKLQALMGEEEAQIRHLEHYAGLGTKRARAKGCGLDDRELSMTTLLELDNLIQGMLNARALDLPSAEARCAWAASNGLEDLGSLAKARQLLEQIPEHAVPPERAAEWLLRRAWLTGAQHGAAEDSALLERAIKVARDIGDRSSEAASLLLRASSRRSCSALVSEKDIRASSYGAPLAIYRELGDRYGEARVWVEIGHTQVLAKQHVAARAHVEEALAISRSLGNLRGEASCLYNLGIVLIEIEPNEAADAFHHALEIARSMGNRRIEAKVHLGLGNLAWRARDFAQCQRSYERCITIARETGNVMEESTCLHNLGCLNRSAGQLERAEECLERALSRLDRIGHSQRIAISRLDLGVIQLDLDKVAAAIDNLTLAVDVFKALGSLKDEAEAQSELGVALLRRGAIDDAEAHLRCAIELGRASDVPHTPESLSHFEVFGRLALVLAHRKDFKVARALIDEATPVLRDQGSDAYGYLLCHRAKVQWLAGDRIASKTSQARAQVVADELNEMPRSPLRRELERTRQFCSEPA